MSDRSIKFLGQSDIKFSVDGRNLGELRRAELRQIAGKLNLNNDGTKNEILHRLNNHLTSIGASAELTDP